jgi:hypothetical protein
LPQSHVSRQINRRAGGHRFRLVGRETEEKVATESG